MRQRKKAPSCSRCPNTEDLETWGRQLFCRPCRTCPHERVLYEGEICYGCLCDYFTVWSFIGPVIADFAGYVALCEQLDGEIASLNTHNQYEEELLMGFIERRGDSPFATAGDFWTRNQGTNSANGPGKPVSMSERTDTSPYPPLHHLVRGRR